MGDAGRDIAEAIARSGGLTPAKLGLRFDRVVGRVLGDLRAFAETAVPEGAAVVVTVTAPIRLPARTVEALKVRIGELVASGAADRAEAVHGNRTGLRLVKPTSAERPKLVGFVHNPGTDPNDLLDLAERWLSE